MDLEYNGKIYNEKTYFSEWADLYLETRKGDVSWSRFRDLEHCLSNTKLYLGDMEIGEVRTFHINKILQDFFEKNNFTQKPSSKKTLKAIKGSCGLVFKFAIVNGADVKNPVTMASVPKKATSKTRKALSEEELNLFLSTDYEKMIIPIYIFTFAGIRVGELLPLTWNDLSFKDNSINIVKSVERISNNQYQIKDGTKNGTNRIVPIPAWVMRKLYKHRDISNHMITFKADGGLHTPTSWRKSWETFLKYENLRLYNQIYPQNKRSLYDPGGVPQMMNRVTPHMFRHTYASMLYAAGVDVLSASKLLGHKNIGTTLKIYTHLDEKTKLASIEKFVEFSQKLNK